MKKKQLFLPQLYKGLAVFTPGGDLIYSLESNKQNCWHIHLCLKLQDILDLREPPHFLVPSHTATVDRWLEPQTKTLKTTAEIYPAAKRYQTLLNAIFNTDDSCWQNAPWQEEFCNPIILDRYRELFAPLWENHGLIVRCTPNQIALYPDKQEKNHTKQDYEQYPRMYVLRLFVAGDNKNTEETLKNLYQILEERLSGVYTLRIIDIREHPQTAEDYQIAAIPTLVRILPKPIKRIVGHLDDLEGISEILTDC